MAEGRRSVERRPVRAVEWRPTWAVERRPVVAVARRRRPIALEGPPIVAVRPARRPGSVALEPSAGLRSLGVCPAVRPLVAGIVARAARAACPHRGAARRRDGSRLDACSRGPPGPPRRTSPPPSGRHGGPSRPTRSSRTWTRSIGPGHVRLPARTGCRTRGAAACPCRPAGGRGRLGVALPSTSTVAPAPPGGRAFFGFRSAGFFGRDGLS